MNNEEAYKEVKKITKPVFDKVLKEIDLNLVLVGSEASDKPFFIFIQPHNYRGWYDFDKAEYIPKPHLNKLKTWGLVQHKKINYGKEDLFRFEDYNIRVKKKQIEILNKINSKRWFSIDPYRAKEQVQSFMESMEKINKKILKDFIGLVGGSTEYNLLRHTDETKVTNSTIINKIDPKLTYHTKTHKKVYSEPQVEVYNIVDSIQLIENSIFFKYNQEIAQPLRVLADGMIRLLPQAQEPTKTPLSSSDLIDGIKTVEDVPGIIESYQELGWDDRFKVCEHIRGVLN